VFCRRKIYCDADVIHAGNIEEIITEAMRVHQKNAAEIKVLRRYLAGDQPILCRRKQTREDILTDRIGRWNNSLICVRPATLQVIPHFLFRSRSITPSINGNLL